MADITITAANVRPGAGAVTTRLTAGAAITAGRAVYEDANGLAQLARANSANTDDVVGIAVNDAAAGQPLTVVTAGPVILGDNTTSLAKLYVVSAATAGGIAPIDDIAANDFVSQIGHGSGNTSPGTANTLFVRTNVTGLQAAAAVA
jgi:hypothetical protein